jgi:phage gpG-like protein
MISTRIDVRGNAELQSTLRQLEQAVADPKPLHKLWGIASLRWVDQNFRREGSPAWKPLTANTKAGRRQGRGLGGAKILQDSGDLKNSFNYDYTGKEAVIGSPKEYADYHEEGRSGPWTIRAKRKKALFFQTAGGPVFRRKVTHPGIPQRKMLPTEDQLFSEVKLDEIAQRYLERVIERG